MSPARGMFEGPAVWPGYHAACAAPRCPSRLALVSPGPDLDDMARYAEHEAATGDDAQLVEMRRMLGARWEVER